MPLRTLILLITCVCCARAPAGAAQSQPDVPAVAAASDLKFALEETAAQFRAARARDVKHLMGVVRMMGDTSLTTVNKHYFNIDDQILQEIIEGWSVPEVDLFDDAYSLPLAS